MPKTELLLCPGYPRTVGKKYNIGNCVYMLPTFAEITKRGYGNNGRLHSTAYPNISIPYHIREKTVFASQKTKSINLDI